MKYPTIPTKPWAPYKPVPPPKQVEKKTPVGTLTSQEDSEFTMQTFSDHIKQNFPNVDVDKVKFSLEVCKEYGYYDEVYTHLNIHFFTTEMIDDPKYAQMYQYYEQSLAKYEQDYQAYKTKLKQYKIDEKTYKEECEAWALENAKNTIKKLEKKKKVKK